MGKSKCHENEVKRSVATFLCTFLCTFSFQDCSQTK